MDVAAFERVYESFREFHAFFAAAFGRKQWRQHSQHYLQALLVQSQERRNAENLSETVPASARAMQRFLTEARWDDGAVIGTPPRIPGPQVGSHSSGVGAGRQRFPQTRREVGGSGPAILRCFGKDRQLPGRGVSGSCGAGGSRAGGQALVSARGMDFGRGPVRRGGSAGRPP